MAGAVAPKMPAPARPKAREVPAIGPDGTPIYVPEGGVGELEEGGGRVLTSDAASQVQHQIDVENEPFSIVDYVAAGAHGRLRGQMEAFGVPIDEKIVDFASALGDPSSGEAAKKYIKKLEEVYPSTHAINRVLGTVGGAVAAAEITGGAGGGTGWTGVAGRAARGGIDNVAQNYASDFNEAALGGPAVNSEKMFAAMPKHFLFGSAAVLGVEGLGAVGSELATAGREFAPSLERGAMSAVARDAGGDAALGERIVGLNQGRIPGSAGEVADILSAEQGAIRDVAKKRHGGLVSALEEQHAQDQAFQAARQDHARRGVLAAGEEGVARAEAQRGETLLDAMGRGGALVEDAELGAMAARKGAQREGSGKIVGALAHEESLIAQAEQQAVAARANVEREIREIDSFRKQMSSEYKTAKDLADRLGKERAEHADQLEKALEKSNELNSAADGMLDFDPDYARSIVGRDAPSALDYFNPMDGQKLQRVARAIESAESVAAEQEVRRLSLLGDQIDAAHKRAIGHVTDLEGAIKTLDWQYNHRLGIISGVKASPEINAADAAVQKAVGDGRALVTKAEKDAAELLRASLGKGEGSVSKAHIEGQKLVTQARAEADKIVTEARSAAQKEASAFESMAKEERAALGKEQAAERGKLPKKPDLSTPLDPHVNAARRAAGARPDGMGGSLLGAGISIGHGNVLGAGLSLLSGFASNTARLQGNYLAARVMRGLAKELTAFDQAIKMGAARAIGVTASKAAVAELPKGEDKKRKELTFEKVSERVMQASSNPMVIQNRVQLAMGAWAPAAPQLYAAVLTAAERAQSFLLSVLPRPKVDANSLTPHLEAGDVPDSSKYDFMQYVHAIDDPISVFRDVSSGTVTDQQIEAIRSVYPALYVQMQAEVQRQMMYLQKPIPYERSIHVGRLLGVRTNEVLDPMFQDTLRLAYEEKAEANGPKLGSKSTTAEGRVGKDMMSDAQRVERGE